MIRFDLDRMEVVEVEDYGIVPLPPKSGNYARDRIRDSANVPYFPDGLRTDVKPLEITQSDGPSFQLDRHHLTWQKWDLRVGFTPREGLVLHTVQYWDRGKLRPIMYRASLSELFVPYGDSVPAKNRLNAFDLGEVGIGLLVNSLELGCDCLGEIRYLDGVVNNNDGNAVVITNAICIHEEDYGILWKHTDFKSGQVETRRSRRLVISSIATLGNYEYGFFWYLYQDGSIQYEVKLTGILATGAISPGEKPAYGTLIAPGLYGANHQHFFNVRLDMAVDGVNNTVEEMNSQAAPIGPGNPYGNAWVNVATPLTSEAKARRKVDVRSARRWRIVNPTVKNELDEPVAYTLYPGDNVLSFYQKDAPTIKRAQFVTDHLWVTAYDPSQMFAAGEYPNQHPGGAGLSDYQSADRPLVNTDIVVWYTFGKHHAPRPEDWPVMPVAYIGFRLEPTGFFVGNPALDNPIANHSGHPGHRHESHRGGD
jgi:primary-amine oxidase